MRSGKPSLIIASATVIFLLLALWSGSCGDNSQDVVSFVIFHPSNGSDVKLNVEVARTSAERSRGLMDRTSMDADGGMIFVWESPVNAPFWMKDTLIPLSIAFIAEDGTIVDIQEMKAQSLDQHAPGKPYLYAVEANKDYFTQHGIKPGDKADVGL